MKVLFTKVILLAYVQKMIHPWITTFNKIRKPSFWKYAVLGNHDYGEYVTWKTKEEKAKNFKAIKELYGQMGFNLLLNEHTFIEKRDKDCFSWLSKNWGHNFKQRGDLDKAGQD